MLSMSALLTFFVTKMFDMNSTLFGDTMVPNI